jgi:hypothetical protein
MSALRRVVSPAAGRRRLRAVIVAAFGTADVPVRVFDVVAGRHDLQQIAAGDLLPGGAGRSHEGLADPGDRCCLARRDQAAREASPSTDIAAASAALFWGAPPPARGIARPPVRAAACARGTVSSLIELASHRCVFIHGRCYCVNGNRAPLAANGPARAGRHRRMAIELPKPSDINRLSGRPTHRMRACR